MRPRIAIPHPHGGDPAYAQRALPQYERALRLSGAEPFPIPLDRPPADVMKLIERSAGVLLPGSKADVDPRKFGRAPHPKTKPSDPRRDTVDELLLQDAYNMRKPILGICYGLQILNVYRSGTLLQHIESSINHDRGRRVAVAHRVEIEPGSKLARILRPPPVAGRLELDGSRGPGACEDRVFGREDKLLIPANSSHHQSADVVGDGLKVAARSPEDGIIEALEGTSPHHFVLGVQWHPEWSFDNEEGSRRIFLALVEAAGQSHRELAGEFETTV